MIRPNEVVAFRESRARYPESAPFDPEEAYPEYRFGEPGSEPNPAYAAVRGALELAGLDSANAGTSRWNPLADLIGEGETVVLKPNLVKESHPRDPAGWRYVMTHGSVIRAVADYVFAAVGPGGRVLVADAPQTDSSFAAVVERLGLDAIRRFYAGQGLTLDVVDLRQEEWTNRGGVIVERRKLAGDPAGGVAYDLADASEFVGHAGHGRYYGADYDSAVVNRHHSGGRHEYLISRSVMAADVVLSLPKLKSHKKAGITSSLKNLVGVNADKNWLPHHTEGSPGSGGDEHPTMDVKHRVERMGAAALRGLAVRVPAVGTRLLALARRGGVHVFGDTETVVRSGNWWGNDTVWRMCLDLNKVVSYGTPEGTLRAEVPESRRRHFSLVDGIVAGHRRGPMNPDPLDAGLVLFGVNAPSADAAATYLFGFDPDLVPIVRQAFECRRYPLAEWSWRDVRVLSNVPEWRGPLRDVDPATTLRAEPHFAWKGHVELTSAVPAGSEDG